VILSVAIGHDYSTHTMDIVLENETRKGEVDTIKRRLMRFRLGFVFENNQLFSFFSQ